MRCGKGMMCRLQRALFVALEQRKFLDPRKRVCLTRCHSHSADQATANSVERRRRHRIGARRCQQQISTLEAGAFHRHAVEACQLTAELVTFAFEYGQPTRTGLLGILGERVDRFARELRPFGNPYASYSSAFAQRSVERLKPTTAHEVAQVFDGVPEPQVRLVGAVPFHGSGKRHPGKGGRHAFARLIPKRHQHRLHHCVDIVRRHEGRLQIDLGELRLPVGPQVLVPETTGELEIAIEPRSHQDLLVYLRRLGQRVELPGMHA